MPGLLPKRLTSVARDRKTHSRRRPIPRGKFGPYELKEPIGRGGMAIVFLARDLRRAGASQLVAVKRIHAHLAEDPLFTAMFMDEARVTSQINHPNVCQVFDYGTQAGTPYLAMEYLVGRSLAWVRQAIRDKRPDSFDAAHAAVVACIIADACEGLHAAHELRDEAGERLDVVHRDVSLENIFLTYDGYAKVVDFGTVKSRDQRHSTAVGTMKGKMSYMQPEVLGGAAADRRADIWGLGVVAWELLTGQRLFRRRSEVETLHAVLSDPIAAPSTIRARLPRAYDEALMRALARDPGHRYATARELGRALLDVAAKTDGLAYRADVAKWLSELGAPAVQDEVITETTNRVPSLGAPSLRTLTTSNRVTETDGNEPTARSVITVRPPAAANARPERLRPLILAILLVNTLLLLSLVSDRDDGPQFVRIPRAAHNETGRSFPEARVTYEAEARAVEPVTTPAPGMWPASRKHATVPAARPIQMRESGF